MLIRRLRDAILLDIAVANAYHLLVIAGRYYSARAAMKAEDPCPTR